MKDGGLGRGIVEVILRGPDGRVKDREVVTNKLTEAGQAAIAEQLLDSPAIVTPKYMAVGEGEVEAKASDTTLGKELSPRKALTSKTRSGNVVTMKAAWAAGEATGKITEAGVLTASSSGTLYLRTVFGLKTKEAGDTLEIVWKYTQEAA